MPLKNIQISANQFIKFRCIPPQDHWTFFQKKNNKYDSFLLGMHFSVAVASVQQHVGHIKVRNFKLRQNPVKILEGKQIGNKTRFRW